MLASQRLFCASLEAVALHITSHYMLRYIHYTCHYLTCAICLPQLFICQYHIWLAADTKGILVLIPGNPTLNIMVSTFIFVCVAHEISLITNDLAQVVIPKDSVALLKRLGFLGLFSVIVLLLARSSKPMPGA